MVVLATYSWGPRIVSNVAIDLAKKSKNLNKSGSGVVESAVNLSHGHRSRCAICSWMFLYHNPTGYIPRGVRSLKNHTMSPCFIGGLLIHKI